MARISLQLGFQKLPCCFFAALVCECVHSGGYLKVFWGEASIKGVFSLPVDYYIFSRLNEWAFSWTDLAVKKYSHFAIQSSPRLQVSQLRGKQKKSKNGKCNSREMNACLFLFFFYWTYHFFLLFQHLPLLSDTCRSACTLVYPAQVHTAVLETRELVVISQCTTSQKKDILDVLTFSCMTKAIIKQRKNQSRDIAQTNQLRQQ